ncbi:hypothetical protein EDD11_008295 [Mortierella claussenii]|nr:hypothetical protein EDD11_008295 [Mortierella claussenii]
MRPKFVFFANRPAPSEPSGTDMGVASSDSAPADTMSDTSQEIVLVPETQKALEDEASFVTVSRRKPRPNVMIPTAAFGDTSVTLKTKRAMLAARIKGLALPLGQPTVQGLQVAGQTTESYFVFEVGSETEIEALRKAGVTQQREGQDDLSFYFQIMTDAQHAAEEGRNVEIMSLQYTTTGAEVKTAMAVYGEVESVSISAHAKVVYVSAAAVNKMIADNVTLVFVRHDSGIVVRRGLQTVTYDKTLSKKMAHLPLGIIPRELTRALQGAKGIFCGVIMPLNMYTKQRLPQGYVLFCNPEDQSHFCRSSSQGPLRTVADTKGKDKATETKSNTSIKGVGYLDMASGKKGPFSNGVKVANGNATASTCGTSGNQAGTPNIGSPNLAAYEKELAVYREANLATQVKIQGHNQMLRLLQEQINGVRDEMRASFADVSRRLDYMMNHIATKAQQPSAVGQQSHDRPEEDIHHDARRRQDKGVLRLSREREQKEAEVQNQQNFETRNTNAAVYAADIHAQLQMIQQQQATMESQRIAMAEQQQNIQDLEAVCV